MNVEILFVADDFGLSHETNAAIVCAHREGALRGASLMLGQAATAEAVELARQNPQLQIGWHLHLCQSRPLTRDAWPWGDAPARAGWAIGLSRCARELMRREIRAQWDAFAATGLPCAFVNSHHHLHIHPVVYDALLRAVPHDFGGWLRLGRPRFFSASPRARLTQALAWSFRRRACPVRTSDTLWGIDRTFRMNAGEVRAAMAVLPAGLHEFMFHPRSLADDKDLAALMDLRHR